MAKPRVPIDIRKMATPINAAYVDQVIRGLRDKGYMDMDGLLGLGGETALDVFCGPGYVGLEWLKRTQGTRILGVDSDADRLLYARRNAVEYGLPARAEYRHEDLSGRFAFEDRSFDTAFSYGTLYEWRDPVHVFREMYRVLRPSGRMMVFDLRRDLTFMFRQVLMNSIALKSTRDNLAAVIDSSYTPDEIRGLLEGSGIGDVKVTPTTYGMTITTCKEA